MNPEDGAGSDERREPECFADVNLDQVVASVTAGREVYRLEPFFYAPLRTTEAVTYRHEVFRDLDDTTLFGYVEAFAQKMRDMHDHLAHAAKRHYVYQKRSWFLDAAQMYCDAITDLATDFDRADTRSQGFNSFREYLKSYADGSDFQSLMAETRQVKDSLAQVTYCVQIKGNRVTVSRYSSESDYGAEVMDTFERFKQQAVKDYLFKFLDGPDLNHVEAQILGLVAQLFPNEFGALNKYCDDHGDFPDPVIADFEREIQFYTGYLAFAKQFKHAGLAFCYPTVSESKEIDAHGTFDLALANKLVPEGTPVVTNDFFLNDPERVFVVSGPNQGGKTTFARSFGQLHYLAALGCFVPGVEARLFLLDGLFTHFEKEEDITDLRGKLEDDLVRIHGLLAQASSGSILIMNEIFTSTTLHDAIFLGKVILGRITALGILCVCVTFVDELSTLNEATVSMVSAVIPEDSARRTFKVERRPADGLSYAATLAEKYGLTRERLTERVSS